MYITVHNIHTNSNPNSISLAANVISSGGTDISIEVFCDDDATPEEIHAAIAEEARAACRSNSESIGTDAPVMIFGSALQVM